MAFFTPAISFIRFTNAILSSLIFNSVVSSIPSAFTVFTYENGTYPRYQKTYEQLAALFEVPVDYLRTESEEFITEATALYGRRGQAQAKAILDQTQQLFAGGELSEEDEIAFLRDIQTLYLDSKERAKKFTPRKYLKDTTADQ